MSTSAKIILDSISPAGVRLTTMELRYPRFIHAEFMTHRAFSRNAASSRAIPIEKMIEQVEKDPAVPERWGLNGKGMQDHGEMSDEGVLRARVQWLHGRDMMVMRARNMLQLQEQPHKQIVNRLLEPWAHITVIVTATEWKNFFMLRNHPDADPTFAVLAAKMQYAYETSTPTPRDDGDWHLPYVDQDDVDAVLLHVFNPDTDVIQPVFGTGDLEDIVTDMCLKISVARCARVSYLNHDGKRSQIEEDLKMYERLVGAFPMHASPAEHQATPDKRAKNGPYELTWWETRHEHGNFVGWRQHRKMLVGENFPTNRT